MTAEVGKGRPLTKEEIKALLVLIENETVITAKTTNHACSNRLKTEAWQRLTSAFNATVAMCPRTPAQLRLKWENLKKSARKRSANMRMNHMKTGGGPEEYMPPDDILDQVASILGNTTISDLDVTFGGDHEREVYTQICDEDSGDIKPSDLGFESEDPLMPDCNLSSAASLPGIDSINGEELEPTSEKRKRLSFTSPRTGKLKLQYGPKQKRDIAIAEYYNLKKQCLEANLENILLQNEKLKLELEALKSKKGL